MINQQHPYPLSSSPQKNPNIFKKIGAVAALATALTFSSPSQAQDNNTPKQISTKEQVDSIQQVLASTYRYLIYKEGNPIGQMFKDYNFTQEEQEQAFKKISERPETDYVMRSMSIPHLQKLIEQDSITKLYPKQIMKNLVFGDKQMQEIDSAHTQYIEDIITTQMTEIITKYLIYVFEERDNLVAQAQQELQAIEEENARLDEEIARLDNGIKLIESLLNITKEYPLILPDADKPRNE